MLVYQYSNSAIDTKGDKNMSEELRNAVETESWEFVEEVAVASRDIDLAYQAAYAESMDYGFDY